MESAAKSLKLLVVLLLAITLYPGALFAQHYTQTNLVSDIMGAAPTHDPSLVNAWGLSRSSTSPWWVANNGSGTSTLYNGNTGAIIPINGNGIVTIPPPKKAPAGTISTPTGTVFNGSADFVLPAPNSKPAAFIFATEDGTISGWNGGPSAVLAVDNNHNGSANGAVYKGATTADINGTRFLYVTNFRAGRVEVYDTNFMRVRLSEDAFDAGDEVPNGFAPFNVQNIGGSLFVTYAMQDAARHDDVAGDGNGFVEVFTPSGAHIGHLQHGPWLNSPWGVVWTPRDFGEFSNTILVGNFGSGWIAAFNGFTYKFIGFMKNPDDSILTIDGLWSLAFGNGTNAGPSTTLFFSAGPEHESHGLFGTLTPVKAELDGDEE
ncbi:MAG: TIGR03118 family protein [Candidatus Acidiferrum sp.]